MTPAAVYAILLVGEAISMIDAIDSVKTLPTCGDRNSTSTSVYISNPKHPSIATGTKIPIHQPIPYPLRQSLHRTDSYFVHDHPTSLPSCSIPHSNLNPQPIFTCPHHLLRLLLYISAWDTCMLDILISLIEPSTYRPHSQYTERQCTSNLKLWYRKSNRG